MDRPLLIVDFETTGLDPQTSDPIYIGAVLVDSQSFELLQVYESAIRPSALIDGETRAMLNRIGCHLPPEFERTCPHVPDVVEGFQEVFCHHGPMLAAFPLGFQVGFLRKLYSAAGRLDDFDFFARKQLDIEQVGITMDIALDLRMPDYKRDTIIGSLVETDEPAKRMTLEKVYVLAEYLKMVTKYCRPRTPAPA